VVVGAVTETVAVSDPGSADADVSVVLVVLQGRRPGSPRYNHGGKRGGYLEFLHHCLKKSVMKCENFLVVEFEVRRNT
jgi:hypothetical protein